MTAIGLMREAYNENIKIPEALSVVGFDDIRLAEFITPPLTTVQMSQKELARIAFQALLTEVERTASGREHHTYELTTNLVLRRSTALAPSPENALSGKKEARRRNP
jgi:LacI family transcriptional regulator